MRRGGSARSLGKRVLRDVSRSFYVTLRFLPPAMREVTSVGYLLARASDTIADCGGERTARIELLKGFRSLIQGDEVEGFFTQTAELASDAHLSDGERVLMSRLQEVVAWWQSLKEEDLEEVRRVVGTITEGQLWDLTHFGERGGELVRLHAKEELEGYCYQVAGCVGEFWTRVGFLKSPDFATHSEAAMLELGKNYGLGLQLVNILRDVKEDEERGRRYLPGPRADWIRVSRGYLEEGVRYARALKDWRTRVASVLPALIGLETLKLLERASDEELAKGLKVSRATVRKCLARALWFR